MRGRVRRHLSFANVCSLLALTIAVGTGGAYAANTVFSSDIVDGEVKTADLQDGGVTSAKLAPGAVGSAALADGGVTSADLADGSVTSADLAGGAVDTSKVADGSITRAKLAGDAIPPTEVPADAITSAKVADASLTGADLAARSITLANLGGTDRSATIAIRRLAKGSCATITVGLAGAGPGDVGVLSTAQTLPSGEILYLQRITAGAAQLKACNLAGRTKPALSGVPVRVLALR